MALRIKETLVVLIKGGIIGVANIIPGVSGGTLAVVLGIYDRLIESIACFFSFPEKRKEYAFFLVKLLMGAVIATTTSIRE
jgi:putative membrane protein